MELRPVRKCLFLVALILYITPIVTYNAMGDILISVMISQDSDAHSKVLASLLQKLIKEYPQTSISTYNLGGQIEAGVKISREIQRSKPDLVLAVGTMATLAAKKGLRDIPIVFCMVLNPVSSGLVESMSSPGGNITGASLDIPIETQFEYIKSVVPNLRSVGVLYNPNETGAVVQKADKVARNMNLTFIAKPVYSERDVPGALKSLMGDVDAIWSVADGTVFGSQSTQYILLNTLKAGIPFMGLSHSFVKAGALMALSCDFADIGKQAAEIASRILKGENPGKIPVTVPRRVYLSLNLRTAGYISLRIPDQTIKSANEVIK